MRTLSIALEAEAQDIAERLRLRNTALTPGPERETLYEHHPVVRDIAIIATNPIQQTYEVVVKCIIHRQPGTCMIGDFRTGKTKAIEKIIDELKNTFPGLPVGLIIAKGHDPYTEKTFYTDILKDYKHGGANTGTTIERRYRLLSLIEAHAHQFNSDRYLLIVDEGQNWNEMQWNLLRDLTNDLGMAKVTILTVTFGHPELLNIRAKLISKQRTDLIGRFLLRPYAFKGLASDIDFNNTMSAYDDHDLYCYPKNSDISYSEFFMPIAWQSGWRLETESSLAWSAFSHVASRFNQNLNQVGMNWVGGAIRHFLFASTERDCSGFHGSLGKVFKTPAAMATEARYSTW